MMVMRAGPRTLRADDPKQLVATSLLGRSKDCDLKTSDIERFRSNVCGLYERQFHGHDLSSKGINRVSVTFLDYCALSAAVKFINCAHPDARQRRLNLATVPRHVIQRGHNRQATCFAEADDLFCRECLGHSARKYGCRNYA